MPSRRRRLAPAASLVRPSAVGIRSLVEFGNRQSAPSPSSALPPTESSRDPSRSLIRTAAPPCISGRTSYLRVRLAFHPYPHVIPQFCNTGGFGPRRGLTPASPCAWIAHPVSGLVTATPHQRSRPLQTRFRSGSTALPPLNLPGAAPYGRPRRCRHQLVGSFYKRHAVRLAHQREPLLSARPPTARRRWVSETLSSPSRGAFHLSLTVLVPYRWPGST